jgi:hypothetical protein
MVIRTPPGDSRDVEKHKDASEEDYLMHSFLIAGCFVGMILAPCVLAMFTLPGDF